MEDDFGSTETVLLAQEAKLQQLADENRLLESATDSLQQQLKAAQAQASAAQKRAAEAEARLRAKPAAAAGASGGDSQQLGEVVERLKRRAANDRILLEQVWFCVRVA
jgi:outer membrane murein-binding lipoprotein Lpp